MRSSDTLASRVPLRTQGKALSGRMSMPTRARVVKTYKQNKYAISAGFESKVSGQTGWRVGFGYSAHLSCSEAVSKQHVRDEGEQRDDDRKSCPCIHTHCVQILQGLQVAQLFFATLRYLLCNVLLPVIELKNSDPKKDFGH